MAFTAEAPWKASVSEEEFAQRVRLNDSLCIVDDKEFYIRGQIGLAVAGTGHSFNWGVWCSLSEESYEAVIDRWEAADRADDAARFGWLCTALPGYAAPTKGLKTMVHQRPPGMVPCIEVEPGSHPIADEQRDGISVERWHELARAATGG